MTKVTVLGTGLMGSGMSRSLARDGMMVTAWNRTVAKARPLADEGIDVAEDVESAVRDADVVVTMLFDADAAEQVMRQALPEMKPDAIWAQCATVGLDGTARLARLAERHGVPYIDAPVLGTRGPAEQGKLIVLVGGPSEDARRVAPVFDAIGSRTVWVGNRPGDGQRLKLVANAWLLSITAATAQSVALAGNFGLDPELFLKTISGGPLDCDYAQLKGKAMIEGDFTPAFTLGGAAKDSELIAEAMQSADCDGQLMRALHDRFAAAAAHGEPGSQDMAAVVRAFA